MFCYAGLTYLTYIYRLFLLRPVHRFISDKTFKPTHSIDSITVGAINSWKKVESNQIKYLFLLQVYIGPVNSII